MLYATVRQRKIYVKSPSKIIQNGVNVDALVLEMDDEWAMMDSIIVVFTLKYAELEGGKTVTKEVTRQMLHTFGKTVMVPWECLVRTGQLMVSCTGYVANEKVMTTMYPDSFWSVVQSGPVSGDASLDPTPTLYDQIVAAAGAANTAAAAAFEIGADLERKRDNGEFNGQDGISPTVEIGAVQTGAEGEEARVNNTGTGSRVVLNFVLPRGARGLTGGPGPAGYTPQKGVDYFDGADGKDGKDGVAPHIGDNGNWFVGDTDTGKPSRGSDGYTPKRGVDYWTDGDQEAIIREASTEADKAADKAYTAAREANNIAHDLISARDEGLFNGADGAPGKDGQDGTSVTVASVSESNVDGGTNIVRFSDGTMLKVKNGNAGSGGGGADVTAETIEAALGYEPAKKTLVVTASPYGGAAVICDLDYDTVLEAYLDGNDIVVEYLAVRHYLVGLDYEKITFAANSGFDRYVSTIVLDPLLEGRNRGHRYVTSKEYVNYAAAQTLTDAQKTQARSNIGAASAEAVGKKLDATELPTAVNSALAQAKESGEFDGQDGTDGTDGKDGVSPAVSVSKSGKVTTIEITDANGKKTATINDGADGKDGAAGSNGKDGTSVTVASVSESTADGGTNVVTFSDGKKLNVKNGSKGTDGKTPVKGVDYNDGEDGADGQRGTGILKVTATPTPYTTAIGSYTPKYRIALSAVKSQSKVDEVLLGDTIQYDYYQYLVDYLDASFAYISTTRVSIRGATGASGVAGADGKTPVKGTDYFTAADQAELVTQVKAALTTESWTFTLEDGSTVTKAVHVG